MTKEVPAEFPAPEEDDYYVRVSRQIKYKKKRLTRGHTKSKLNYG